MTSANFNSNDIFFRSLFGLEYASFEQQANASLKQLVQLTDQQLSLQIGGITDTSFNVSSWSNNQKEVSKVIVSLTGISGFAAADVKAFQLKAINQLDRLGSDYEQDIINDTMLAGRTGNIEELRTVVVLQKLSALFIQKGLEMEKMKDAYTFDSFIKNASQKYSIELQLLETGVKRLYFMTEEQKGESNIKANSNIRKYCSTVGTDGNPSSIGGRIRGINGSIDMADMGNLLLGYNAKKLGLTLEETILGSGTVQSGITSIDLLPGMIKRWSFGVDFELKQITLTLDNTDFADIKKAYNNEIGDQKTYTKGYDMVDISPKSILQNMNK